MTNPIDVRDWLKALGALVAANMPPEEADARLAAFVPLLSRAFPANAFSAASLETVARTCKFFPTYGELCDALVAWCAEHAAPGLPPPVDDQGLDFLDREWLAYWHKRKAEGFIPLPDRPDIRDWQACRAHVASLVRQRSPKAWRVIEAEDGPKSA